jgi:hypothetical protein
MEGPTGPKAPYLLRRHAEVRGAVTEVHYRIGEKVTFLKILQELSERATAPSGTARYRMLQGFMVRRHFLLEIRLSQHSMAKVDS